MSHLHIAVLRGGPSEEHKVSMETGGAVLRALAETGYQTKDIVISRNGDWIDQGIIRSPEAMLQAVDVVFIALHGSYGEDGQVQKLLQRLNIPFTGSGAFSSAVAFNKHLTKQNLEQHGVQMPAHREVTRDYLNELSYLSSEIKDSFGPEYIIKPVASGSSFGIEFVHAGQSLEEALEKSLDNYEKVLVEEYIRGKEATSAVLENFRNEKMYVFPSVEIVSPQDSSFFSTELKYSGKVEEICPARFSYKERAKLAEVSALVHDTLNLSQYSRSDFIVSDRGIYFLEVNTLPGLTKESLYPKAAAAVGLDMKQLVEHLVETATC